MPTNKQTLRAWDDLYIEYGSGLLQFPCSPHLGDSLFPAVLETPGYEITQAVLDTFLELAEEQLPLCDCQHSVKVQSAVRH